MKARILQFARSTAMPLAILGLVMAMLVLNTTGCGTSTATAQGPVVVTGTVLQTLDGIVVFGADLAADCRIEATPGSGVAFVDPMGVSVVNPQADASQGVLHELRFGRGGGPGAQGDCSIGAVAGLGMILDDPNGFEFTNMVLVQGEVMAEAFVTPSSRRLKANIRPIADALDRILRLEGVYFDWKPDQGGSAAVGFVAEDVAEVLPQAVTRDAETGRVEGVKYANLVAVAVEGIKAQQGELDRLTAENTKLREKVDAMEARLERLLDRLEQLETSR